VGPKKSGTVSDKGSCSIRRPFNDKLVALNLVTHWHRVWEILMFIDTLDATPEVRYAENASFQDSVEETASRRFVFDE